MPRFILSLLALAAGFSLAAAAAPPARPNVLFLIADDLNNYLASYGDPRARTPNLDRLAARGAQFERAYCTYPLCGPSRNSLLTGLYPNSTGILLNSQIFRQTIPQQPSLSQLFRGAGYFTARLGKLYHYNNPGSIGTDGHDDPASWELELNPAGVDRLIEEPDIFSLVPGQFGGTLSWYASPRGDREHTDGILATEAEWMLERFARRPQQPFFLAVGFFRPHTPFVAPRDPYFGWYPEEAMPLFPTLDRNPPEVPAAAMLSSKRENLAMKETQRRQAAQAYYASISFLDAQVGRVVEALDRLGLTDNTIIVFTSDHGYHIGEHGLWQKQSLFEVSARVPLLVVAPGVSSPGSRVAAPVSLVDLVPTLLGLAGLTGPANLQGQDLSPLLRDVRQTGRGWALTQMMRGNAQDRFAGYSLRTGRWRYTEWDEGRQGRELYDHDNDPDELRNLAGVDAHAADVAALQQQLRAAVAASFPPDGKLPGMRAGTWAPTLR